MIYLFSDGYADQFGGPNGKKFKYKPMQELLRNNSGLSPLEQREKLSVTFDSWKGALEQVDDVCVIGIRI
jgi:sigma-B regulation protein RsbU (phosphoserine phosphatase)